MVANAAPRQGDVYLRFNGQDSFVEIPSIADYSIATTGELAVAAWIRPDTLNCWERTGYVHWLGKGEGAGDGGRQEWVFRIYNRDHTTENPPRPNRISFYVFNPDGRLGVGSYFQDTLGTYSVEAWIGSSRKLRKLREAWKKRVADAGFPGRKHAVM